MNTETQRHGGIINKVYKETEIIYMYNDKKLCDFVTLCLIPFFNSCSYLFPLPLCLRHSGENSRGFPGGNCRQA